MRDPRLEKFLSDRGLEFEYVAEVPIESIPTSKSDIENIRPEGEDADTTIHYTEVMRQGQGGMFPPIVVHPLAKGGYRLDGGFHRCKAAKVAGREFFDAYVLKLDDRIDARTIEIVQRSLNSLEGRGHNLNVLILQAVHLVSNGSMKIAEAARLFGIPDNRIQSQIASTQALDRARQSKVVDHARLEKNVEKTGLVQLNRIKQPEVFERAAELATKAIMSIPDITLMVRELVEPGLSDKRREEIMDKWCRDRASDVRETLGGTIGARTSKLRHAVRFESQMRKALEQQAEKSPSTHEIGRMLKQVQKAIKWFQVFEARLLRLKKRAAA